MQMLHMMLSPNKRDRREEIKYAYDLFIKTGAKPCLDNVQDYIDHTIFRNGGVLFINERNEIDGNGSVGYKPTANSQEIFMRKTYGIFDNEEFLL